MGQRHVTATGPHSEGPSPGWPCGDDNRVWGTTRRRCLTFIFFKFFFYLFLEIEEGREEGKNIDV